MSGTCSYLFWFICLMAYQLLIGYLMPKFDRFVNVCLQSWLYFQCSIAFFKLTRFV